MADTTYVVYDTDTSTRKRVRLIDNGDGTYSMAAGVTIDPGDISIGAVELKDADAGTRANILQASTAASSSSNVLLVRPVDETGAIIEGGAGGASEQNYAAPFNVNDIFETDTYLYACLTDELGSWYVKRVAQDGSGVAHATAVNNVSVTTYADAVTNRATLTYGRFDQAF